MAVEDQLVDTEETDAVPVDVAAESAPVVSAATEEKPPLTVSVEGPSSYTQTPEELAEPVQPYIGITPEEKMQEHMNTAADFAAGHIEPKTYHQMFADKGTLGKIGTLFGLMLSGAGSGLAHQPNMLLDMMNREIDRDLEKQKLNVENGRNFLATQYAHNLQQAQIAEHQQGILNKQLEGTKNAAGLQQYLQGIGAPGSSEIMDNYLRQSQQIWAPFEAKAKMLEATGHHLDAVTKNNPRANMMVQQIVKPAIAQQVQTTLTKGAQAVKSMAPNTVGAQPINENVLQKAIFLGQAVPFGLPMPQGAISPQDADKIQTEKGELLQNRKFASDWNDSFQKLAAMGNAGQLPMADTALTGAAGLAGSIGGPIGTAVAGAVGHTAGKGIKDAFERNRTIQKEALMQRLGHGLGKEEKEDLADSILPHWRDTPESMAEAHRKGMQHFQSLEKSPYIDSYAARIPGLKNPFPAFKFGLPNKKGKK